MRLSGKDFVEFIVLKRGKNPPIITGESPKATTMAQISVNLERYAPDYERDDLYNVFTNPLHSYDISQPNYRYRST